VPGNTDGHSLTPNGGPVLGPTDANPERIQLDDLLPGVDFPEVDVGAELAPVQGVVNYDFGNYEVLAGEAPAVAEPSPIEPEITGLAPDARQVTIASYNVENLDPEVESMAAGSDLYTRLGNSDDDAGSGKYARHAEQIAVSLGAPTVVALQEVQDNDGAEISAEVDATETLQALVDLIQANHGVTYAFASRNPGDNEDGGQPNANIRNAFLYRPDGVELLGTGRLTDPDPGEADGFAGDDFADSRKPLVGEFRANGVEFTVVNNHFNSKGGRRRAVRQRPAPRPGQRGAAGRAGGDRQRLCRRASGGRPGGQGGGAGRPERLRLVEPGRGADGRHWRRPDPVRTWPRSCCRRTSGTPTTSWATPRRSTTRW
jgi:predicted extracellular nuclease